MPEKAVKKPAAKKQKPKVEVVAKEEDLKYIYYFYRPQLVEQLWQWELKDDQNPE